MTMTNPTLAQIPPPPTGSSFFLLKIEPVYLPHHFMIGPMHIKEASAHFGGSLGLAALESAFRKGYGCKMLNCMVAPGDHKEILTVFIQVEDNRHLSEIPGLQTYLNAIKHLVSDLGIGGFAFPTSASRT